MVILFSLWCRKLAFVTKIENLAARVQLIISGARKSLYSDRGIASHAVACLGNPLFCFHCLHRIMFSVLNCDSF